MWDAILDDEVERVIVDSSFHVDAFPLPRLRSSFGSMISVGR